MALKAIDQIQWYELETNTWQSYSVNWEDSAVFEQGLSGGVYFFRRGRLVLKTDGSETLVTDIESALPDTGVKLYPDPFSVASDALYLSISGFGGLTFRRFRTNQYSWSEWYSPAPH